MNILIVGKGSKDYPSTVGNIINNIVTSEAFSHDNLYILCAKSKFTKAKNGSNYQHLEYRDFSIESYENYSNLSLLKKLSILFKKAFNSLYARIYLDYDYFSYFFARNEAYKLCIDKKIDCVFALAGVFSSFELANYISKKLKVPLIMLYLDIFAPEQAGARNKKARKIEDRWQKQAARIIMPKSYIESYGESGFDTSKFIESYFPAFLNETQLKSLKLGNRISDGAKTFIFAGFFYRRLREPDEFLLVAKSLIKRGYHIICYGETRETMENKFGPSPAYDNIIWKKIISQNELIDELAKCRGLINAENKFGARFPSKMLQYLGFGKLIVNLNCDRKKVTEYLDEHYESIISSSDYYNSLNLEKIDLFVDEIIKRSENEYKGVFLNESINTKIHNIIAKTLADTK